MTGQLVKARNMMIQTLVAADVLVSDFGDRGFTDG